MKRNAEVGFFTKSSNFLGDKEIMADPIRGFQGQLFDHAETGRDDRLAVGSGRLEMRALPLGDPLSGEQNMTAEHMTRLLQQARDDTSLKAVILRIDSPGGDALASDAIWRAVNDLHTRKPLVISMSDVAGSGGYYIAASGDPIVAGAGTLTASIGVVHGKINVHGLYDKLGITKDLVTRGPNSTLDSDYVPYTPQQW